MSLQAIPGIHLAYQRIDILQETAFKTPLNILIDINFNYFQLNIIVIFVLSDMIH